MRPTKIDFDVADAVATGLAAANSSAGASVTLDGTLTAGGTYTAADGFGHRIIITDTATLDQSTATFTVTGTNANDEVVSESLAGPASTATVTTVAYFKTVISVTIASPVATATVNIGTNGEVASKVIPVNWMEPDGCTTAIMGAVGTFNVDIEETFDAVLANGTLLANFWNKQAAKTADGAFTMTPRATGVRVSTNSYTNGAEFQFHVLSSVSG